MIVTFVLRIPDAVPHRSHELVVMLFAVVESPIGLSE
jgi:hypothetical protein